MFTPDSATKFEFATLVGPLLEEGDYCNSGYYSNRYCNYFVWRKKNTSVLDPFELMLNG